MHRSVPRVTRWRVAASLLALLAVADLAHGLGVFDRPAAPRAGSVPSTRPTRADHRPRPGTRGVRVEVPGARVRAGDRVDVLVTLDPDRYPSAEPTREVGRALVVLATDRDGPDPTARGVTLAVPETLVARVAFAATAGVLTLAVVPDRGPAR